MTFTSSMRARLRLASSPLASYPRVVPRGLLFLSLTLAIALSCGCTEGNPASPGGGGGGGDAGADCPNGPVAMLDLDIEAAAGPVPSDTKLLVSWSAGAEPIFALDDPKTWSTLADGNVVCDVDRSAPPPTDLPHLVCHLWTSGVTHVQVKADGHKPYDAMLKPKYSAACKGPVPTQVAIKLTVVPDGGTP